MKARFPWTFNITLQPPSAKNLYHSRIWVRVSIGWGYQERIRAGSLLQSTPGAIRDFSQGCESVFLPAADPGPAFPRPLGAPPPLPLFGLDQACPSAQWRCG
jgi:hypothetical protein